MSQGAQAHIADIDFSAFYATIFDGSVEASTKFYEMVATPGVYSDAKTILHQTARMVWLADRIDEVAKGRPAFQILFYLTAAELIAKIVSKYEGECESKRHVQRFFSEICESPQKERLQKAFRTVGGSFLTLEAAVSFLYRIRCDVVHRGHIFSLAFHWAHARFRCSLVRAMRISSLRSHFWSSDKLSLREQFWQQGGPQASNEI